MSNKVRKGYSKPAPVKTTMIIQLDDDLKKDFQKFCKNNDMTCSQVLRKFMSNLVNGKFSNFS